MRSAAEILKGTFGKRRTKTSYKDDDHEDHYDRDDASDDASDDATDVNALVNDIEMLDYACQKVVDSRNRSVAHSIVMRAKGALSVAAAFVLETADLLKSEGLSAKLEELAGSVHSFSEAAKELQKTESFVILTTAFGSLYQKAWNLIPIPIRVSLPNTMPSGLLTSMTLM